MEIAILIGTAIALWIVIILPVQWAASLMGAERTGCLWCLLALSGASILHALGLLVPVIGTIVAFLLSAAAFAAILGTGYLKGIGIAILQVIFSIIIYVIVAVIAIGFGISIFNLSWFSI